MSGWLPQHDEALRALVEAGFSFQQAANAINARFGTTFTRCAAIGRANRKGIKAAFLPNGKKLERQKRKQVRKPGERKVIPKPIAVSAAVPMRCDEVDGTLNLPLLELQAGMCKWPVSGWQPGMPPYRAPDEPPTLFCGHSALKGLRYCAAHQRASVGEGTYSEQRAHREARA